jgi:hypothetical protein
MARYYLTKVCWKQQALFYWLENNIPTVLQTHRSNLEVSSGKNTALLRTLAMDSRTVKKAE